MARGMESEPSSKKEIDATCLKFVARAQTEPCLHVMVEVLRVIAAFLGKEARWLEGCECHEDIHTMKSTFTSRKRLYMEVSGGCSVCPWKGKRSAEMARGRLSHILIGLHQCSSPRLQMLIARTTGPVRTKALELMQRLRSRLSESLTAKLEFWNHIPWSFCGIWDMGWKPAAALGQPLHLSDSRHKMLTRAVLEYDNLIAAKLKADIPRTAHKLFGPGVLRNAIDFLISLHCMRCHT